MFSLINNFYAIDENEIIDNAEMDKRMHKSSSFVEFSGKLCYYMRYS